MENTMLTNEEKEIAWTLAQEDGRIVPWATYGEHIDLCCKNHPDLRWNTKNICSIGSRTIFYNLGQDRNMANECSCGQNCLIPVEPKEWDLV
jgi:hypothetical protein